MNNNRFGYNNEEMAVADKIANGETLNKREHAVAYKMANNNTCYNNHRYGWNNYKMFGRRNKEI